MSKARSLALAAAGQAVAALPELMERARHWSGPAGRFDEEIVELLADATKIAIEAQGGPRDDEEGQLYAALCKYLEFWA